MPEEVVEIKFRLYDGSDMGPFRYSPASTITMLKERIVAEWPKGLFFHFLFHMTQGCFVFNVGLGPRDAYIGFFVPLTFVISS